MAIPQKPIVLMAACSFSGHTLPIKAVAKGLVARGYEVTFIAGSHFKKSFEDTGIDFVPLSGYADIDEAKLDIILPLRSTIPAGLPQMVYDMEHLFVNSLPTHFEYHQRTLKVLKDKNPERAIIAVNDPFFLGLTPILNGASGLRAKGNVSLGISAVFFSSQDTAPPGSGLPPDNSAEGRKRNQAGNKFIKEDLMGKVQQRYEEVLKQVGATTNNIAFFLDGAYTLPDRFLQMSIPSVEYPRSDAPSTFQFTGGLPKADQKPWINQPSWWREAVTNKSKKVVALSQGTISLDYTDLMIPTMNALQDRDDILVIAVLGIMNAPIPEGMPIPANARVVDYIPYDELLPYADVFVTNGGYGGFQQAISYGTPMVIAGGTEDKPEVAMRAEWTGVGLNLKTRTPAIEAIATAVNDVLSNVKYKKRALELKAEMATYEPLDVIANCIDELAGITST